MSHWRTRSACICIAIAATAAGCYDELATCGALTCPTGMECSSDETCVLPAQLTACAGMALPDGATCNFGDPMVSGFCRHGACVVARCGDGFVDPNEVCDDGNNASFDGCRADCQGRFQDMNVLPAVVYFGVWADDHHAYAVGELGTVIEIDGSTVTDLSTSTLAAIGFATAVWANGTDIWVGGQHGLFRWDGKTWTRESVGATPIITSIKTIWGIGGDVYAGGRDTTTGKATLFHWTQATGWTDAAATLPASCVAQQGDVDALWAGTNVSLLSSSSTLVVCTWSPASPAKATVTNLLTTDGSALALTGDDTGVYAAFYTAAGAPIIQRVGDARPIGVPGSVSSIAVTGPGELLTVGTSGQMLRLDLTAPDPSQGWTRVPTLSPVQLRAVAGTSPTNLFVVGDAGTVLH